MPTARKLTIIAQDPSIKSDGRILTTQVSIPHEELDVGPRGYRISVVDYDATQRALYRPFDPRGKDDVFCKVSDRRLLTDPGFHAQNVYAIVMRLLARFESALGRRVSWSFGGHQIQIVPHAFAEANAYYSDDAHGLLFGYFPDERGRTVFTCLSHDIIAHEATHAIVDGLRETYTVPSHPDQAGFHEGFADIVALLSVFGLRDVVRKLLAADGAASTTHVRKDRLAIKALRNSVLLGLAEQFGQSASRYRADCLRRAVGRRPQRGALQNLEFEECHIRGEILSAAVLNAFIDVWEKRLATWLPKRDRWVPLDRVVEDGADAADHLLTMCIRALDYCPVVDITFPDFLSALLTADLELLPDDGKYNYRTVLRKQFARWDIEPASGGREDVAGGVVPEPGVWERPAAPELLDYSGVHRESLERNPDEVFRFLWENRGALGISTDAFTWVISVRPCVRVGPDGFILKETVSEYRQTLDLEARQLSQIRDGRQRLSRPEGMAPDTDVRLQGGGVLIFDEFGHLKYHIRSRIRNANRQNARLDYLWRNGIRDRLGRYGFSDGAPKGQRFALMHRRRDATLGDNDEWSDDQTHA